MSVTAPLLYYGSNRHNAEVPGQLLDRCDHVSVVFAGGMSECMHIRARSLVVNDAHRHVINFARTAADEELGPQLERRLQEIIHHPDELRDAQDYCRLLDLPGRAECDPLEWAEAYFICCWMARHETAGTKREFDAGFSVRWNANGGDSATHFRSGVAFLSEFRKSMLRTNFVCMDFREFLQHVKDETQCGIYADPPFAGPGRKYKHTMNDGDHHDLANDLNRREHNTIVCRFYAHPLVDGLYPESKGWNRVTVQGRKQTNEKVEEIWLLKEPSQ